jgi:feruloyl esterase
MKRTFFGFPRLFLTVAVFVLSSNIAVAQMNRGEDVRTSNRSSAGRLTLLHGLADPQPSIFPLRSSVTSQITSAANCSQMLSLHLPDTEITSAQLIPADPNSGLPEYCDVMGFTEKTIGFDVRMPTNWNGKMYFAGNRGFAGHIRYNTSDGLTRNYATVSTDTGHQVSSDLDILDASWALNDRPAEIDFGFRAVHLTAVVGKTIIASYYGLAAKYSYFDGCSGGGGQSLREAEMFPEDFDGYIAGAPVFDFRGTLLALNWKMKAIQATPDTDIISLDNLALVGNAVLEACDAIDGLKDGLIGDPRKCHFDPVSLLCKKGNQTNCLTSDQVHAFQLIYQGPRTTWGMQLFPGLAKGGETPDGFGSGDGWDGMINTPGSPSAEFILQDQFLRYLAFRVDNPNYDWNTFNFNSDWQKTDLMASILDATDSDLSRFHKLGRKLLIYHGWSDETASPLRTLEYYRDVHNRLGSKQTADSIRLFMAPGMFHCDNGGPGPNTFDYISALERWVEKGVPPEKMLATHFDLNGNPDRTRPLCAYPKIAKYNGSGSIDDASNFSCVAPADDNDEGGN